MGFEIQNRSQPTRFGKPFPEFVQTAVTKRYHQNQGRQTVFLLAQISVGHPFVTHCFLLRLPLLPRMS
jgi:hypothetical protein